MLAKFLARGTSSARDAADYLLGERDAAGKPREGVEVLRGDPNEVAAVADSLDFEHRYTSGVIAWAPEDEPTDAEIETVPDAFEDIAWTGLEPDRYAWAVVLHRERGGGAHVHILAARCDLETGRSLNIGPPGWRRTFDPLHDAFNQQIARSSDAGEIARNAADGRWDLLDCGRGLGCGHGPSHLAPFEAEDHRTPRSRAGSRLDGEPSAAKQVQTHGSEGGQDGSGIRPSRPHCGPPPRLDALDGCPGTAAAGFAGGRMVADRPWAAPDRVAIQGSESPESVANRRKRDDRKLRFEARTKPAS